MGRHIKKRKKTYYLNIAIPEVLRPRYGGKSKLEDTLQTSDEKLALALAQDRAARLKLEAMQAQGNGSAQEALKRLAYEDAKQLVLSGEFRSDGAEELLGNGEWQEVDPVEAAVDFELTEIREQQWQRVDPEDPYARPVPEPLEEARANGLVDGLRLYRRQEPQHANRYEAPFLETAKEWLEEWQRTPGRKAANTADQYRASIEAFTEWWGARPIRAITEATAAAYVSHLKRVSPGQARHRKQRQAEVAPGKVGLSVATIRRHVGTLSQVWTWAKPRLRLTGDNPWSGVAPRKEKRPPNEHMPWTHPELSRLLIENQPKRRDVYEAALMALFSGMRAGEVANLTWGQVSKVEGIWCIHLVDAKTKAGIRRVPVHGALEWLLQKPRGADADPIWPGFNPEGPSDSRGDDLSRLFGRYKKGLGFGTGKTFHSFRKNVTEKAEELEVPGNIWSRIIGHEPGFTYGVYNPTGLTPAKAKQVIDRIGYGDLSFPEPDCVYGKDKTDD